MVLSLKITAVSLLLSFTISSCKKEVKKTRIQVLEYKSDIPIAGAYVGYEKMINSTGPYPTFKTLFEGHTDANGYCDVTDDVIASATQVGFSSPDYYAFGTYYFNIATVFKLDKIGNVKIHLVDTTGFGMTCRLYIYPERPLTFYHNVLNWELKSLPETNIPPDYSFVSTAFGGQPNNLQLIRNGPDTINTFVNVSRTDTTFVEIRY